MAEKQRDLLQIASNLKDITECCICQEFLKDPKILPCIHTFCLECLERTGVSLQRRPGLGMPCPVCRREFTIPMGGFSALQKNFFLERLVEMMPAFVSKLENEEVGTGDLTTRSSASSSDTVSNFCLKHELQILNIFCNDCKDVLCRLCFQESHQNHRLADLGHVTSNLRKDIEDDLANLSTLKTEALQKTEILRNDEDRFLQKMNHIESVVIATRDEIKKIADEQATGLLRNLDALRRQRLGLMKTEEEKFETHLACLESFMKYCKEMVSKGSSSDICLTSGDLRNRAAELAEQHPLLLEQTLPPIPVYFAKPFSGGFESIGEIKDTIEYEDEPALVSTVTTNAVKGNQEKSIHGLTILGIELFILGSEIEVYDLLTLKFLRSWKLDEITEAKDLKSCAKNDCLYIMNWTEDNEIWRVDPNGKLIGKWSTSEDYGRMSITNRGTILLAVYSKNKLNEYTPNGEKMREIALKTDPNVMNPWDVVMLSNGNYVISLNRKEEGIDGLCVVDDSGLILKSYGTKEHLYAPVSLIRDGCDNIIVVDMCKHRLLLFNQALERQSVLISEDNGLLRYPWAVCLDESVGRLFVSFNDSETNVVQVYSIWN